MSSLKRHPDYPDLPTIAETFPGYEVTSWFGLAAPANTPKPIVDMLNAAMRKALADPEAIKQLANAGLEPAVSAPKGSAPITRPRSTSGPRSRAPLT